MIKLKEILHRLQQEAEKGLTPVDKWSIPDSDFMNDMDFKPDGQYTFSLKNPHIKVYHKKGVGFVVDDYSKTKKQEETTGAKGYDNMPPVEEKENKPIRYTFPTFNELTDYFTKYEQKWENEPYKS